jgi:hypothetical protein
MGCSKKGRDAWDAAASRYGVPASISHEAEGEALPQFLGRSLGANNLHDIG